MREYSSNLAAKKLLKQRYSEILEKICSTKLQNRRKKKDIIELYLGSSKFDASHFPVSSRSHLNYFVKDYEDTKNTLECDCRPIWIGVVQKNLFDYSICGYKKSVTNCKAVKSTRDFAVDRSGEGGDDKKKRIIEINIRVPPLILMW